MPAERKAIEIVQDLIRDCSDTRQSYRYAAEHATDQELRAFFSEQSVERGELASQLQQVMAQEFGESERGSDAGATHRAWVPPRHSGGDKELLNAIEKRESLSRKIYEEAAQQDLPDSLAEVVARQAEAVKAAHDHLNLVGRRISREQAA